MACLPIKRIPLLKIYIHLHFCCTKNSVDTHGFVIMDEYDEIIPYDDFVKLVESKQSDPFCRDNPDNF